MCCIWCCSTTDHHRTLKIETKTKKKKITTNNSKQMLERFIYNFTYDLSILSIKMFDKRYLLCKEIWKCFFFLLMNKGFFRDFSEIKKSARKKFVHIIKLNWYGGRGHVPFMLNSSISLHLNWFKSILNTHTQTQKNTSIIQNVK